MTSPSTDRLYSSNSSLAYKAPCKVATTANITLSGEQTIDGVSVVTGDRVLVKDQTTGSENGIYIADTSTWSRSPDFDGTRDITEGTMVRVNRGTSNASAVFTLSTMGDITIGTTSLSFQREATTSVTKVSFTASAGQTLFNLGVTYQTGANGLGVYINGLRQRITDDFTETSSTTFTMAYALRSGDEVDCYVGSALGSISAAAASGVTVSDAGDYWVGTTVEAVLQELAGGIAADNGDADVTFTNASSSRVQRFNTPLTANRTLTLSTSSAKEGASVTIVRGSGATGNFTLSFGSLATLRAPGEWAEARYDSGTSAWVLIGYGILPSAEILAMKSDVGDADATLTVGSSERTQRWATTLTAERAATLSTTGAYTGARFRVMRAESATGAYSLSVLVGTTRLIRLAPGQYADFECNGSTWVVVAYGDVRPDLSSRVVLQDDYLGEEIDGYRWQSLIGTDASCRQATVLADQASGVVRLTTGADAGASMAANGVQLQSRLNWKGNLGGLVWEGKVTMSSITSVCVFVGLTDQVSSLEMPFTLAAGDALTTNATDAVGVLFDTAADTDNWWLVGVTSGVAATKQNTGVAPVASTFETWRIEVQTNGTALFYRNGTLVGTAMSGAVGPSVLLTPVIAAFARTSTSRDIDVDFQSVAQQR